MTCNRKLIAFRVDSRTRKFFLTDSCSDLTRGPGMGTLMQNQYRHASDGDARNVCSTPRVSVLLQDRDLRELLRQNVGSRALQEPKRRKFGAKVNRRRPGRFCAI
jgi:hypothetical protein